jgi:protein-arginine deiminase
MRAPFLFFALAASCTYAAGPYRSAPDDGGGPDVDAGPTAFAVDLLVDSNRDGTLDAADDEGQDAWGPDHGAIFLANVDDDDLDRVPDAEDSVVGGESDLLDLARLRITAWPDAPIHTGATLSIDSLSESHVRVFRDVDGVWTPISWPLTMNARDLRVGAELAIEGLALLQDGSWNGRVTLHLVVTSPEGATLQDETAVLREAPVIMPWNTEPTDTVYVSNIGDSEGQILIDAIVQATAENGERSYVINGLDPYYTVDGWVDQWAQDFFEVGATWMPSATGWQRLGIGIRLKPPASSGLFPEHELFGPDYGVIEPFGDLRDYDIYAIGSSLDYGGNIETVPPYEGYPVGRLLQGSHPDRHPHERYMAYLNAQYAQGPVLEADTRWLVVGHIDEYMSFVADPSSPRGWKMLLTSPREAWQMLQDLVDEDPANADVVMFEGKFWADDRGGDGDPADITIGDVLADPGLAADQDEAQTHADDLHALMMKEVGLTEYDFVYIPFLWEAFGGSRQYLAYVPGMTNLLTFDGVTLVPKPFGPIIDGEDPFEVVVRERLEALGLDVRFVDNWSLYHRLEGEIHCGSQGERSLPDGTVWWEMSR